MRRLPVPGSRRRDDTDDVHTNRLLAFLPAADFRRFAAHFERVTLRTKQVLFESDRPIDHVYFPQNGTVISLVTPMQDGSSIEAVTVGSEGFVGLGVYL